MYISVCVCACLKDVWDCPEKVQNIYLCISATPWRMDRYTCRNQMWQWTNPLKIIDVFLPLKLKPSLKLAGIINSWTLPRYTMHLQACAILFGLRGTVDKATAGPPPQPYPPSSSRTEPRNPCKRCGPSGCSKGQLSLRQHPEPPCNTASAQNSEIWNQMWHKRNKKQVLKQKLMTVRHSTWVGFQPACISCQMDRYDGGIWL